MSNTTDADVSVLAELRAQHARRAEERKRIKTIAEQPCDDLHEDNNKQQNDDARDENENKAASIVQQVVSPVRSPARCHSPTEDSVLTAQLQARVAVLENESESLRSVVDLARRENAVLRAVLVRVATAALGNEWKTKVSLTSEEGVVMTGMGQPAAELTWTQRERLIELLGGVPANLLP